MLWVGPCMHEAYGDGFNLVILNEAPDRFHHVAAIERNNFVALVIHTLTHADDSLPRNERLRFGDPGDMFDLVVRKIIHATNGTHDLGGIFESFGDDEANLYAAVSDKRVSCHRAAVLKKRCLAEKFWCFDTHGARGLDDSIHDAARKIVWCRGRLCRPHLSCTTQHDDVGESSAGIHADDIIFLRGHRYPSRR